MATVQIDLSEYDILRESKNKAEEEVKTLKETLKGLENKSRVILTTKYVLPNVKENLFDELQYLVSRVLANNHYYHSNYNFRKEFENMMFRVIKDFNIHDKESSQYIGFEDVRAKVEEHFKEEIKESIEINKKAAYEFEKKMNEAESMVRVEYQDKIDKFTKDRDRLIEKNKQEKDKLEQEIYNLKQQINELSKSKEEKISELNSIITDAKKKLETLEGKKEGIFSKFFKNN